MISTDIINKLIPKLEPIFRDGSTCRITALPASAEAATVWALQKSLHATVVLILDGPNSLEIAHRNLLTLAPGKSPSLLFFPPRDISRAQEKSPDHDITGQRLNILANIGKSSGRHDGAVIVTCIQALMQKVVPPSELQNSTSILSVGEEKEMESVTKFLEEAGYNFEPEVQEKGQASTKGGLLDVWPTTETWPLRVEFTGAEIESIRAFNPADQRSLGKIKSVVITPANETLRADMSAIAPRSTADTLNSSCVLSYLPENTVFVWSDPDNIREHAGIFEESTAESKSAEDNLTFDQLVSLINTKTGVKQVITGIEESADADTPVVPFPAFDAITGISGQRHEIFQPDLLEEARRKLLSNLNSRAVDGQTVIMFFDTAGSLEHHKKLLEKSGYNKIITAEGALSEGFSCEALNLTVVAEPDLYGTRKTSARLYDPEPAKKRPDRITGMRMSDLTDIEPGDLVVHVDHGIGKYLGMREIMFNGQLQEVLSIEYADNAKLHVPVSQTHLLSRYVGASHHNARLHSLGGKTWTREKIAAERSVADLAASLLQTQAQRDLLEGYAYSADTPWQFEFETSFPYVETPDQKRVIAEVKRDMESTRPMDRLVCGDAGYGKTEVAMRAAFKAVMNHRQVAVLVPTTVLAQQHFERFSERMAPYPVQVEMLSRFCTASRHDNVIKGITSGAVDIVIGTHALLQSNIRFKNLGLVIIDEEQRFGVLHKEKLKQMRQLVDILTMTATPIPRTLYMSMTGARDLSLLQTPPGERMAIETIVARNTDEIIRNAVMRELNREGQIFYLHNRVTTIEQVRQRLEQIVPEARIAVAHGQMTSNVLSDVMAKFVAGEYEILLCTTIIESGMDIPRANTILIDRADRFGMGDLYQLRGRVGRSNHKAYAYLLLPAHGHIDFDARKRIGTVRKFSGLSAGFNIAMRDLEIRGAGNMLGREQSGHISAIGFGLYCQLLRRSVAHLKKEPVPPIIDVDLKFDFIRLTSDSTVTGNSAVIPFEYIEDERIRISVYRKIAEACTLQEIAGLIEEFTDRFGAVPPPLNRLLKMAEIRIICAGHNIKAVETREGKVMMMQNNDYLMTDHRFPRLRGSTPDQQLDEIIKIAKSS